MKNILLIGPPAGGKSTICDKLTKEYGYVHISTGDLLRDIDSSSMLGKKIQDTLLKGELVSDEIVIRLLKQKLSEIEGKPFILDGFPRTINQASQLDDILKSYNLTLDLVIDMDVSFDTLIKRVVGREICPKCDKIYNKFYMPSKVSGICDECGSTLTSRIDDNEETFKVRYDNYIKESYPLIEFYDKLGLLKKVDGNDNLYENIVREINDD